MQSLKNVLEKTLKFRIAMGLSLTKDDIKYIWGRRSLKILEDSKEEDVQKLLESLKENENEIPSKKIKIARKYLNKLKLFNWVKFIGISGSVAAGFADEDDDIDVFVVVRNGTMWMYRAITIFKNLFHNRIRAKRHKNVKNKLCLNLICEERGLQFEPDIFNFHELLFLKPIYKREYKKFILSQNSWLRKKFLVKKELLITRVLPQKKVLFPVRIINHIAFYSQLLFMLISGHKPDIKRLKKNSKKGRIEFFEFDYRKNKIRDYEKEFKSIN